MSEQHAEQQPEPSIEEFVTGLQNPDGSINEEAVARLDEEEGVKAPEDGKEGESEKTDAPERDEQGRFKAREDKDTEEGAAKDKKASDTEEKDTEPEKGKKPDKGEEEKAEKEGEDKAEEPVKPPATMSARDREAFYKLPPDQQKWLAESAKQMQSGASKQIAEYAERVKAVEPVERVLGKYQQMFAHMGARPEQVVDQLLTLADHADKDFVGFVREQARLRNIPMEAFGTQQTGENGQDRSYAPDPEITALKQQVSELTEIIQNQQQTQQTQALSSMERAVDDFIADESNPFADELMADMSPIVQALRASDPSASPRDILGKAYRAALSMNDEVRGKVEADTRAREEAVRERKQREDAARARREAVSDTSGSGALPPGEQLPDNMDEFVLREARRLGA